MSNDQQQQDETGGRRFDDVASLFGTIVPPAGTPVRPPAPAAPIVLAPEPTAERPAAPTRAAPSLGSRTKIAGPPELRRVNPPAQVQPGKSGRSSGKSKRAATPPWPDAFQPRPNWRQKRVSRAWTWLILVPFAAIAAVGVATIDPKTVRSVVDSAISRFNGQPAPEPPSLLPGPFRPNAATAPQSQPAEPAPAATAPAATAPAATAPAAPAITPSTTGNTEPPASAEPSPTPPPTPTLEQEVPAPAPAPTSALTPATPPAPEPQAPAVPAAEPALPQPPVPPLSAPAFMKATILYRRGVSAAEAEARRIAAHLGAAVGSTDLRPATALPRAPVLTYFSDSDKDAATALARSLATTGSGASWIVRAGPARPAGTVELAIP